MPGPLLSIAARTARQSIASILKEKGKNYSLKEVRKAMKPAMAQFRKAAKKRMLTEAGIPKNRGKYRFDGVKIVSIKGRHFVSRRKPGDLRRSAKATTAKRVRPHHFPRMYVRIDQYPRNLLVGGRKFKGRYHRMSRSSIQKLVQPDIDAYFNAFSAKLDELDRR